MPGSQRSPQRQPLVRGQRAGAGWCGLVAIAAAAALWALFATAPPLDEIDAASRAQLEEALAKPNVRSPRRDARAARPARVRAGEILRLASWAVPSAASRGRVYGEAEHPYRTAFQRDRDRIVHSRAFRRLEYKTQVFVYHEGDHLRNRLTHTLEASQIARTIARALRLNEELAEAVVLAHDLGHTPFGHAGERVLAELMKEHATSITTAKPAHRGLAEER